MLSPQNPVLNYVLPLALQTVLLRLLIVVSMVRERVRVDCKDEEQVLCVRVCVCVCVCAKLLKYFQLMFPN